MTTPTEMDAYLQLPELRKLFTFEQAMAKPAIAQALKNTAHAMDKAAKETRENFALESV